MDRLFHLDGAPPLNPAFPPEPGWLEPAIGKRSSDDHRILGDIARAQLPSDAPHRLVVIRKDAAVEAVFAVVCDSDGIGFAFVRDDGDHRPENLLARDRHAIVDPVEQRRLHEIAAIELRSEEHTSELQSLMRISYAVF